MGPDPRYPLKLGALGAALALLPLWAGCLRDADPACNVPTCPAVPGVSPSDPLTSPPAGDDAPGVALNRTIEFQSCGQGVAGVVQAPYESARGVVPGDFAVHGMTSETASIYFEALVCSRLIVNRRVFEAVPLLTTSVFVNPRNESWDEQGTDRYLLDVRVGGADAALALAAWGLDASAAEFAWTTQELAGGARQRRLVASDGAATFTAEYRTLGQPGVTGSGPFHFWQGPSGPYRRVDASLDYAYDTQSDAGLLQLEGNSRSRTAIGDAGAATQQGVITMNMVWTMNDEEFG